eukprot:gene17284-19011_t
MDNMVDKKLSELSRGFGTTSGKLIRDTTFYSCNDSIDLNEQRSPSHNKLNDLFLLRIEGSNDNTIQQLRNYNQQQSEQQTKTDDKSVHKTYSTRGGNLILYTESLYKGSRKKRKAKRGHKKAKKSEFDDVIFKGTCEDLTDSILRFGNGDFRHMRDENKIFRDDGVISVRPGYSPMRYVASASKLWDPRWVDKLLSNKAIKESHLEKYKKIQFPRIDVIPSSNYDPLLREKPKPYSRISLPDIFFRSKESSIAIVANNSEEHTHFGDNTSSGYAKSFYSEGQSHIPQNLPRKRTMRLNKLQLEIPSETVSKTDHAEELDDEEQSDYYESISEWNQRGEAYHNSTNKTVDDLKEHAAKQGSPRSSSLRSSAKRTEHHEKEDVISRLLLKGIVTSKDTSDMDSLMSGDTVANAQRSIEANNKITQHKIDIADGASLPSIHEGGSLLDSYSIKGFKGNALHRTNNYPSSGDSSKTNRSKDSLSSGNKAAAGFLISSPFAKLPPIKSEPATPNTCEGDKITGEQLQQQVKLPHIYKKAIDLMKSNRLLAADGEDNASNNLLVDARNGRAVVDVDHVDICIVDAANKIEGLVDVGVSGEMNNEANKGMGSSESGEIEVLEEEDQEVGDIELNAETADHHAAIPESVNVNFKSLVMIIPPFHPTDGLAPRDIKGGHQSPDSGRSTGTGLTSVSDGKIGQQQQQQQHDFAHSKDPMTPVAEESSRASLASKGFSREGTFNRTMDSMKQQSFVREQSSGMKPPSSLAERVEESLLIIRGMASEVEVAAAGIASGDDENEAIAEEMETGSMGSSKDTEDYGNDRLSSMPDVETLVDEGVVVDEDNVKIEPNKTDNDAEEGLSRGKTFLTDKTITESIDIISDHSDFHHHDEHSGSEQRVSDRVQSVHRDSEGSFISSTTLHSQARAAARSALSRPKSGMDLVEDMKVASVAFGELFEKNINQTVTSSKLERGRSESESRFRGKSSKDATAARSISSLSSKRTRLVDINELKANVASLENLIDKKINQRSPKPTINESKAILEGDNPVEDKFGSGKSDDVISESDIQVDIIGYVGPAKSSTTSEKVEPTIAEEDKSSKKGVDTAKVIVRETTDEIFQKALNSIVNDVKDLKESKELVDKKPSKHKKGRKHDRTAASPPFYAGKVKESKTPKGLSRVDEGKKKATDVVPAKSKAVTGKKGKKKAGKKDADGQKNKSNSNIIGEEGKMLDVEKKEVKADSEKSKGSNNESKDVEELIVNEDVRVSDGDSKSMKDAKTIEKVIDKYDVPITIKTAAEKPVKSSDDVMHPRADVEDKIEVKSDVQEKAEFLKQVSLIRRDTLTETETEGSFVMSANEDGNEERIAAARARGRMLAAERRRLKVEQKRKEREEAKKRALLEAEKVEKLRQEEELEMQRRMEDYRKQKELAEQDRMKKEKEENEKMRRLELEKDRARREREEQMKMKAAIAARLRREEELKREKERLARELEEEMRRQEEEKLKQMEEDERLEYQRQKKLDEEERLRQEEERQKLEREKRMVEEEELRIKMQKLAEFHRLLLERAKFWEGMKNSKWFLELNQKLTRAFTFSYFDLLPAMLFPFTDLRPFTPKDEAPPAPKLPTIPEENN